MQIFVSLSVIIAKYKYKLPYYSTRLAWCTTTIGARVTIASIIHYERAPLNFQSIRLDHANLLVKLCKSKTGSKNSWPNTNNTSGSPVNTCPTNVANAIVAHLVSQVTIQKLSIVCLHAHFLNEKQHTWRTFTYPVMFKPFSVMLLSSAGKQLPFLQCEIKTRRTRLAVTSEKRVKS